MQVNIKIDLFNVGLLLISWGGTVIVEQFFKKIKIAKCNYNTVKVSRTSLKIPAGRNGSGVNSISIHITEGADKSLAWPN